MDYSNYALKDLLLRVGTVRRKIILQKLKNKLEENGLTKQQVYNGLVQLVLRPRVHLTRLNIVKSLHLRSHINKEIVECEESSPQESAQENKGKVGTEELPTTIAAIEASNQSDFADSTPCEKPDISPASATEIPELLAENVGNRIPAFIAKKPRKAITLHLNSHGPTKRPRIVEDVICVEGTIFDGLSFSNISKPLTEWPPAKKSKCDEVIIEEKKEKEEEEDDEEEEEEELVIIMANAVEGKRENTNIEATQRCRLRKKFRQLFGKIVTLSEIEEEDELMNESIPKKRRKESRMSLDSGVCLSEVISDRVTVSPDEFHEKIVEEIEELPAEHDQVNSIVLSDKNCDFDPLVRSVPIIDSDSRTKIDNVFPEALPDISANLTEKPTINSDSFGGTFKILITPFDTNGADAFAPMSLEFDLTNGSHVATTTCTTQFVSNQNSTSTKKKIDNYDDFSTLFQLDPKKDQQDNTVSIHGENGARVTTNIVVSTEKDVEIKMLKADTAAILTESFASTSQTKCQVETNEGDDSTVKCKNFNQKMISSAPDTNFANKIVFSENTNQKSIEPVVRTCLKDRFVDSENLNKKSIRPVTETCLKDKIVDFRKETCITDKTLDSNQITILSTSESCTNDDTSNSNNQTQKTVFSIKQTCNNEDKSNSTNLNETTLPSKSKYSDQISSVTHNINGQTPLQSINSTLQIEDIAIKNKGPKGERVGINNKLPEVAAVALKKEVSKGEELGIKNKLPEVAVLAIKNKLTAITADQEQQINVENTSGVQEQQINVENTSGVQEQQINVENTSGVQEQQINVENTSGVQEQQINVENTSGVQEQQINVENTPKSQCQPINVENTPTNTKYNQISSNSMPKLRLLHHSELGSRWCPTPMNETVSSTSDNISNQIQPPIAPITIQPPIAPITIQPCLQATNSAELFYPDNQLQYLPYFLGNVGPVTINNTSNLCNNSPQNCYNIPEKRPTYPAPGFFVPQKAATGKKVSLPANINLLSSTTTKNIPNFYGNTAPNSYNNSGKNLFYGSSDYSLPQRTTISKETPSNANTNLLSSTTTSNIQNIYGNAVTNNYNNPEKQLTNFSTGYSVSHETTITKEATIVANTNLSSSTITNNSYNKEILIRYNISGTQTVNLAHDCSVPQRMTNNQKTPTPAHTNCSSNTITNNLYSKDAAIGHNIIEKVSASIPIDYSVTQGITSNQKTLSPASKNFPSSTITSNNQIVQNINNISQKQLIQLPQGYSVVQGTTSNQKSTLPANINFASSTITSNNQMVQNINNISQKQLIQLPHGYSVESTSPANINFSSSTITNNNQTTQNINNIPQKQLTNVSQGTTNNLQTPSPANTNCSSTSQNNNDAYSLDAVFFKVHKYVFKLQSIIRLSCMSPSFDERAKLEKQFFDNKELLFTEIRKYCVLLNTHDINIAVEDFVKRYEQLVEPDMRQFDLQQVLLICRLENLAFVNAGAQGQISQYPSAISATISVPRCQYVKKNSTSRVAENKQRCFAAAQSGSTIVSAVSQSGTSNSLTSPTFISPVPQNGTSPTFIYPVSQNGTSPTFTSAVIQKGTTSTFASAVSQNGTTSTIASAVFQNGTTSTFVAAVRQPGTENLRTSPTFTSPVRQNGTPPTVTSAVPLNGTPPTVTSAVRQNGTPPTVTSAVPLNGTPPTVTSAVRQNGTPPTVTSAVVQKGITSTFTSAIPQNGTTSTFVSSVPHHGTGNSRTLPTFALAVPQPGTTNPRIPPIFPSGVPQPGTGNSRTPPTFASGVPQNVPTSTLISGVPQPGTGNSQTPPTFAFGVPQNVATSTLISGVSQPGTVNSQTPPTFAFGVPQNVVTNPRTTSTFTSTVPRPQFPMPRQPPATAPSKRKHDPPQNERPCYFVYSAEALRRLNQQIEYYNMLWRRMYKINMQDPIYRQLYRQTVAKNILQQEKLRRTRMNIEQNHQHELRQRSVIPTQQEIALSQIMINNGSTFVPSTVNNSRSQPNSTRVNVLAGNLENIRNLVENFNVHRKIAIQNPTNCNNQARIPIPVENINAQQEMRQNSPNSIQIIRNQMENIVESTLRSYLMVNNTNAQLQQHKNTAATVLQNPLNNFLENRGNIAVSMENNNPDLQIRTAPPFQPNTPQEAINNRNVQLEMRLSSATNQLSTSKEFRGSRNKNKKTVSSNKKQRQNSTVQESAAQLPKNSGTSSGNAKTSEQKNLTIRKPNRKNRKNQTRTKNDKQTVNEPEQMNDNAQWEVRTNSLKTSDQQRAHELKVRLKRVNIPANDDSDNQLELQQSSVVAVEPVSVPAVTQVEIQTSFVAEIEEITCQEAVCSNTKNISVSADKSQSERRKSPALNQETVGKNCSLLACNDSRQTDNNVSINLIDDRPELRQSSAVKIVNETLNSKSKNIEKISSNGCNVRFVDVFEEFDALSPNKKKKKSSSTVAQSSASFLKKCLPIVTTIVPIDLIEESAKTENHQSEEEDNNFTLYQSDDESKVSTVSKISVITINDDEDDDFNLLWIEESKTAETANKEETKNEQVTLPQSAEIAEKEEIEMKKITSLDNVETAENKNNEIRDVTLSENAETAEKEANEIRELTLPENVESAEKKVNENEITLPQNAEIVVEVEEEAFDRISCEIDQTPKQIQDEPLEIFSILDVKSISKDVFNNMRDSGDIEPTMSPNIQESKKVDNLEIKDVLLPNCFRCSKSSSVVCEQCYSAFYCSAECHHTHWTEFHHLSCKPVPEEDRELIP